VENLLNMSRLESGFLKPRLDWCDLPELLHETVKGIEEVPIRQTIHIHHDPDLPLFRLDKGMMQQIVYNLLSNACLHTPAGTQITVSAESRAGALRLVIEDDGKGFPEDEIEFVFDKFYRLRQSSTIGTGLGLSIVKGFTEALGGRIHLQNMPDGGCRFTIEMPAETSYIKV
jgi:two-component system sensor histidine kinase KdpD